MYFNKVHYSDTMKKGPIKSKLIPGFGRHPFPAYRGNDKYIFVSYAHDDEDFVYPEIARFQYMKYNVWYDEILGPGNEWEKDLRKHLINSGLFIIFVTKNSVGSDYCQNEFYCALKHKKPIIPIYLEDFDSLPIDEKWKKDLTKIQGILTTTLTEEEYVYKFTEAFQKFGFKYGGIEITEDDSEKLLDELDYYKNFEVKRASLFIDGSFDDFHSERDYIIKEVLPELKVWAKQRKIFLTSIDLRWGITEEESANRETIDSYLEKIDRSRPFYMCLLGQRRSWVPDLNSDISEKTKSKYPFINSLDGLSTTEMGIEYALNQCRHLLFFFRNPEYLKDISDAQRKLYTNEYLKNDDFIRYADEKLIEYYSKIKNLKNDNDKNIRINEYECLWNRDLTVPELDSISLENGNVLYDSGENFGKLTNFTCNNQPLKEVILEQLKDALMMEFPENIADYGIKKEFTEEIQAELSYYQESGNEFAIDFSINDIHHEDYFRDLNIIGTLSNHDKMFKDYLENDDNRICLLSGDEGYGKTTLLSNLSYSLKDNPNVYTRFCGISKTSSDIYSLWTSIILEAMIRNNQTRFYSYPMNYYDLFTNFDKILNELAGYGKTLIIIDGADYLDNILEFLKIIRNIPENLKIIISIENNPHDETFTDKLSKLKNSEYIYSIELNGLNEMEKRALIEKHLDLYGKKLDTDQTDMICSLNNSDNPLFLKIILSELIEFGSSIHLNNKIKSFDDSLTETFNLILERIENNYPELAYYMFFLFEIDFTLSPEYITRKLSKLANVSESEVRDAVKSMLIKLDDFIRINENGCIFLNKSLKEAIREKYG